MDIRNYPKSFEIIFLEIIQLLGLGSIPRMGNFFFFAFLFNLTLLELRIIPVQKIRQNIKNFFEKIIFLT
jgi:hypothetical protein